MTDADLEDLPTVEECTDAAGKLLLILDLYSSWVEGNLSTTETDDQRPTEIAERLKGVIAAVEGLWEHRRLPSVNRIHRDNEIRELYELLVDFYKQNDVQAGVPASIAQDLAAAWSLSSVYPLKPGQLKLLTGPVDSQVGEDGQGPAQMAKYRLGKLFQLGSRQVHNIVKATPESWPGFNHSLQNPLKIKPPLDVARRSAAHFFARRVLDVDAAELVGLLRPDAVVKKRRNGVLVDVGRLEGPGDVSERLEEATATELMDFIKDWCSPNVYEAVVHALADQGMPGPQSPS